MILLLTISKRNSFPLFTSIPFSFVRFVFDNVLFLYYHFTYTYPVPVFSDCGLSCVFSIVEAIKKTR